MRLRVRTLIIAVLLLLLLTAAPLIGGGLLPEEAYLYLSTTAGVDLRAVINEVAVLGVVIASIVVAGDLYEQNTRLGFYLSTLTRIIWVALTVFALSLGDLGHLGFARIGSSVGLSFNMLEIDLRLFAILIAVIMALKIAYSYLDYTGGFSPPPKEPETV